MTSHLYILAGANGSGKSTISKELLPAEDVDYINPDDIAKDVRRRYCRSKRNFVARYAALADHWLLYYNGGAEILLVAHGNGATNVIVSGLYDEFMEDVCRK